MVRTPEAEEVRPIVLVAAVALVLLVVVWGRALAMILGWVPVP